MRKVVATGIMLAMIGASSAGSLAAAQDAGAGTGSVTGNAQGPNLHGLARVRVQIRNMNTGDLVGATTTTDTGEFSFSGLPAADYVVEVTDGAGKILGIGTPFSLPAGTVATASVLSLAPGTAVAAGSGGFSLFGLNTVSSLAVIGAASAAAVTGVVATQPDASPSR